MDSRTLQLIIQYDGARFAGWQRQPEERTVQGVLEQAMERLCGTRVSVLGAGRTDAGVHALGQSAGVRVPIRWTPVEMHRALNAVLPADVRISSCHEMRDDFHARYSAVSRSYRYLVATDDDASSPFRSRWELGWNRPLDRKALDETASVLSGEHTFRAFAVRGTAPEGDDHRCTVSLAEWSDRPGGLTFRISANRFLHHMVRFLVGTMLDIGTGKRPVDAMLRLLDSDDNREVSPPAPAHALYLERVDYPPELYLDVA